MVMSKNAPPAIIGPGRIANVPTGMPGVIVHAEDAVAGKALEQPVLDHRLAPPRPSSAGWKMKLTVPSNLRVSAR